MKEQHVKSTFFLLIMLRSSLLLLLIVAVLSPALGCDWLRGYRDLRNRTVVLIQTMVSSHAPLEGGGGGSCCFYRRHLKLCLFLFQGGPMAVQDPTDYFPYNLYRQVHSQGVSRPSESVVSWVL